VVFLVVWEFSMDPFLISPTEALLIGLSLEEFLQIKKTNPRVSFLQILDKRLGTFIPDLWQQKRVGITEAGIPGDVEWLVEDETTKRGTSRSNPDRVYGLTDDGAYYEVNDISRKSNRSQGDLGEARDFRYSLGCHG
jgi:hypothetical protein